MGKSKGGGNSQPQKKGKERQQTNPITGEVKFIAGTKAGKKRQRLPIGHPLRTHDLRGPVGGSKKKKKLVEFS